MNNQLVWSFKDVIKENFERYIRQGAKRDELILTSAKNAMTAKEMASALNSLIIDDIIEPKNEDEFIITEGYYNWLLRKLSNKEVEVGVEDNFVNISNKLKQRFCKDTGIPITIYDEPYFTSRLELYDAYYDSISKYKEFIKLIKNFTSEQDYFEYYNKIKDEIITYLGESEDMKKFKEEDMNKFAIKNTGFPKRDIYKETNINRRFLSIDMVKANFSAMRSYSYYIVGEKDSYEDFIGMFTKYEHLKSSKYLRQVVFGNHSPKRQVTYEKYLMDSVLTNMLSIFKKEDILAYGNDEIVIDITDLDKDWQDELMNELIPLQIEFFSTFGIKVRAEFFDLKKVHGTGGYVKRFLNGDKDEFKCLNSIELPFVLRYLQGQEVHKQDKVFIYENKLAQLLEVPNIRIE